MSILIEKNIPITDKKKLSKYPFFEMELNDSFFVSKKINYMSSLVNQKNKLTHRKFVCRKDGEGTRVWRVK